MTNERYERGVETLNGLFAAKEIFEQKGLIGG